MFENKNKFILYIDVEDKLLYDQLTDQGVFRGRNRSKFLFAMAYGLKNGASLPLENKDTSGFWRFFESELEDRALVYSVALCDIKHLNIKNEEDLRKIFEVAEKYARGGLKLLNNTFKNVPNGTFWKKMELDLVDLFRKHKPEESSEI